MKNFFIFTLFLFCSTNTSCAAPAFVIGQDNQSIVDYLDSSNTTIKPDGFMVYTAINDLRGLDVSVDHGAGVNHADYLLEKYPDLNMVQIGLYMKYMLLPTIRGYFDENIKELVSWISDCDCRVYLRIGYEFDNMDNEYDPIQYINAYRYIVDKMRAYEVKNVDFVWHTIAWKDNHWPEYDPIKWYPGDDYVDWVGISFFDHHQEKERQIATTIAKNLNKPLMIAESAPFKQYTEDEKKEWVLSLFSYVEKNNIQFLSYINVNWDDMEMFSDEGWGDSRLENDPSLVDFFEKKLRDFLTNSN